MKTSASPRPGRNALAALLVRGARRVREVIAEYAYAQRRLAELATSADRFVLDPNTAPDTYAEFLFRTSGLLHREAPADARADG